MSKLMLIDAAHPEETRVAIVNNGQVDDFDFETTGNEQLRGNIYLAKVTRVEPSLQAAFVEYGGNRHGFLAFSEIHPDYYQLPAEDREALLREAAEEAAAAPLRMTTRKTTKTAPLPRPTTRPMTMARKTRQAPKTTRLKRMMRTKPKTLPPKKTAMARTARRKPSLPRRPAANRPANHPAGPPSPSATRSRKLSVAVR